MLGMSHPETHAWVAWFLTRRDPGFKVQGAKAGLAVCVCVCVRGKVEVSLISRMRSKGNHC